MRDVVSIDHLIDKQNILSDLASHLSNTIREAFMVTKSKIKFNKRGIPKDILEKNKHIFDVERKGKTLACSTENKGHSNPGGRSIDQIRVDATNGFIPLWAENQTLRWRVNMPSMHYFDDAEEGKKYFKDLFSYGVSMWEDAVPVRFTYDDDLYDFEIVMRSYDDCDGNSCTMADAFFPDGGRNELNFYPFMFEFEDEEIFDTMAHELGHIFGLRHFFANISELDYPSELFGNDNAFSIMNYGELGKITQQDINDLKELYRQAWSREIIHINNTPIRLLTPYSVNICNQIS